MLPTTRLPERRPRSSVSRLRIVAAGCGGYPKRFDFSSGGAVRTRASCAECADQQSPRYPTEGRGPSNATTPCNPFRAGPGGPSVNGIRKMDRNGIWKLDTFRWGGGLLRGAVIGGLRAVAAEGANVGSGGPRQPPSVPHWVASSSSALTRVPPPAVGPGRESRTRCLRTRSAGIVEDVARGPPRTTATPGLA